jgi:ribosomal protein S19
MTSNITVEGVFILPQQAEEIYQQIRSTCNIKCHCRRVFIIPQQAEEIHQQIKFTCDIKDHCGRVFILPQQAGSQPITCHIWHGIP